MTDRNEPPWWKRQGSVSLIAFWGVLGGLSLFILATPERPQQILQSDAPVGYRFTFEEMRLQDQGEDSSTLIYAEKATYDRRRAQVTLVAPTVIMQSTAGEDLWRTTAGQGIAEVARRTELFPSSLGDIRMETDVVIEDIANGRVLSTSGVVYYLAADRVLFSTDRTWVRTKRSRALFPYGFLMETQDGVRVRQGRPGSDLLGEYLARRQSHHDTTANRKGK